MFLNTFLKEYPQYREIIRKSTTSSLGRSSMGSTKIFDRQIPKSDQVYEIITRDPYKDSKRKLSKSFVIKTNEKDFLKNQYAKLEYLENYWLDVQSFIKKNPKLDFLFNAYQINSDRVDVIEVKESSQKPVCSSAGLYKIRTSDGNTGIDPARLRQMIVGYESFKRALLCECTENLVLLSSIRAYSVAKPPQASLNELTYSTIDAILANGTLSSFFNILALNEVRRLCVQINKLLDFAVSAGGVIIEAQVFYDKINELCPVLQAKITDLLSKLGG